MNGFMGENVGTKRSVLLHGELWGRVIAHVDMDAFFAAVEVRNNPSLKGKPVIVGGPLDSRGVVAACSYEARAFGVHSGMPLGQAKRLCPDAVVAQGTPSQYGFVSAQVMKILLNYTPLVEPVSVDEAFCDLTASIRLHGGVVALVERLKGEIREQLALSCSVGVGPSKIIAKMASGLKKPDGLTILSHTEYRRVFGPRPARELWGVGEKTSSALAHLGIVTISQLAEYEVNRLRKTLGKSGVFLRSLARGEELNVVHAIDDLPMEKSLSHETTFPKDSTDREFIREALLALSEKVARRLRSAGWLTRTVSVKFRSGDFRTITRDKTLPAPTDDHMVIFSAAMTLWPPRYGDSIPVRLVGVKAGNLIDPESENQLTLFEKSESDRPPSTKRVGDALDRVKDKYGDDAIGLASLSNQRGR